MKNTDHAIERYDEIVNLVLYGKSYLHYFTEDEYIEDVITLNGDDWTFKQHQKIDTIPMKLVEFEVNRNRELLNIMIIEEPEAHIHTHIQKTLFNNLQVAHTYTQVVMSTHSTHLSEVSDLSFIMSDSYIKNINRSLYSRFPMKYI